ncbi:MAG: metallophosphoesterase family protein [Planctomycetota bacterium]
MTFNRVFVPTLILAASLISIGVFTSPAPRAAAAPSAPASNLLDGAQWRYRLNDEPWQEEPAMLPVGFHGEVSAVIDFEAQAELIDEAVCLELTHNFIPHVNVAYRLNGKQAALSPMQAGFFSQRFLNISKSLISGGKNELSFTVTVVNTKDRPQPFSKLEMVLALKRAEDLTFRTEPVVSAFSADGVWISCRTNIPAEVTASASWADGERKTAETVVDRNDSPLAHRFFVPRRGNRLEYSVTARCGDAAKTTKVYTLPLWSNDQPLRFAVHGDTQRQPETWARVAKAIQRDRPAFLASIGDMNENGQCNWRWDPEFFAPAAELFATIPYYPTIGNHDVSYHSDIKNRRTDSPLLDEFFVTPEGPRRSWAQQFGKVLMISIVGHEDFSRGTDRHKWLEGVLSGSDAAYIFLLDHYPAWSSSYYGKLNPDGSQPRWYAESHQIREVIVPLLTKYNATALICGHNHYYQRSETPDGFTQVLTGTAGSASPLGAVVPAGNNPHAVIGLGGEHYCLFEVTDTGCTMTVKRPDGEVIDTRTWTPRKRADR